MKKLIGIAVLLLATLAAAQDLVTVTATNIQSRPGVLLPSGQITFQPANSDGASIGYRIGGAGQVTKTPVVCIIVAGVITGAVGGGTCQLANTDTTSPLHVCFRTTVKNAAGIPVLGPTGVPNAPASGYECLQPAVTNSWCTAAVCNFDSYSPLGVATALLSPGPTGGPGPTGATGAPGTAAANSGLDMTCTTTPGNPASGHVAVWCDSTTKIFALKDAAGNNVAPVARPGDKGFINSVTDGGIASDTTSDVCTTLQAVIDANPGKRIFLPSLVNPGVGAVATPKSYTSSCRLIVRGGNNTVLYGPTPGSDLGSTKIKFPSGVGGIKVETTCTGCGVENLFLEGGDVADSSVTTTYEEYTSISAITNLSTDGLELTGSKQFANNVRVSSFKGNGVEVYGSSGGQPDNWSLNRIYSDSNRGFGIFITGTDANVGLGEQFDLRANNLGGLYDAAFYGNTYNVVHTTLNARNGVAAGTNKTIAAANGIVVTSNVATITTTAAHGWSVNQWITSTGSGDTSFNGTCRLLTVPTTTTATCNFTHADGNTSNGTVATSSGTQVNDYYVAKGIDAAPLSFHSTAGNTVCITCYMESNQRAPIYNTGTIVIGPQGTADVTATTGGHSMVAGAGPILVFKGGWWVFQSLTSGENLVVRDLAGNNTSKIFPQTGQAWFNGSIALNGATSENSPPTIGLQMANANGVYINKNPNTGTVRALYLHSDNVLHIGDTVQPTTIDGPASTAGLHTFSLGAKLAASQSFSTIGVLFASTAPTISSGFGTSPTIANTNGTASFTINVGTGGTATSGVVGLPTATTGWTCWVNDLTAAAAHVAYNTRQTASSTTTATLENQTTSTGAAVAWAASDILRVSCFAY